MDVRILKHLKKICKEWIQMKKRINVIFEKKIGMGSAGIWTQDLPHAKRKLYHYSMVSDESYIKAGL